jgi:hypothetical protein
MRYSFKAMTIFQAEEYDFRKARRRNIAIAVAVIVVIVLGIFAWLYRNWPEEHTVQKFMTALENKDYKAAYGYWVADKEWEQHPQKYSQYPFADFYRDWGPGGDWGEIKSFNVQGSTVPKDSYSSGNGVVVAVTINHRKEPASIWVTKKDHTLSFSPFEVVQ